MASLWEEAKFISKSLCSFRHYLFTVCAFFSSELFWCILVSKVAEKCRLPLLPSLLGSYYGDVGPEFSAITGHNFLRLFRYSLLSISYYCNSVRLSSIPSALRIRQWPPDLMVQCLDTLDSTSYMSGCLKRWLKICDTRNRSKLSFVFQSTPSLHAGLSNKKRGITKQKIWSEHLCFRSHSPYFVSRQRRSRENKTRHSSR